MVNMRRWLLLWAPLISGREGLPERVECETSQGRIQVEVRREWAPRGADRFLTLVEDGFFQDIALFRCVPGFLSQFGISGDPQKKHWHHEAIPDDEHGDELLHGIRKYHLSFAGSGPNSRTTQVFVAYNDLPYLGKADWEVPFGVVTEGRGVVDSWYTGYGDIPPWGKGPEQSRIMKEGNDYIHKEFPSMDFIKFCKILPPENPTNIDTATVEDRLLRSNSSVGRATATDSIQSEEVRTRKALVAVAVLVVAVAILLCLYKFSSLTDTGKSK